jgi:hypothetical protein
MLRVSALYLPLLPMYRMVVYFFRLEGILATLSEDPQWTKADGWLSQVDLTPTKDLGRLLRRGLDVWAD